MLFIIWKAKVLEEYRLWNGYDLSPIDEDVIGFLRNIHKLGLSAREARIAIDTMEEYGPIEATRRIGSILSGETYKPMRNGIQGNLDHCIKTEEFTVKEIDRLKSLKPAVEFSSKNIETMLSEAEDVLKDFSSQDEISQMKQRVMAETNPKKAKAIILEYVNDWEDM